MCLESSCGHTLCSSFMFFIMSFFFFFLKFCKEVKKGNVRENRVLHLKVRGDSGNIFIM